MTHEQFAAQYRLLSERAADGVETWDAERADSNEPVMVHRLVTSRRVSILDMMAHLDADERSRVVEQFLVDDVPVVVTRPLPDSLTFIEWLQNSVPSTVTAVIRPLKPRAKTPVEPEVETTVPAPAADQALDPQPETVESLTALFNAADIRLPSRKPEEPAPERAAPPTEPPPAHETPATPLENLVGGLTAIFSASELKERVHTPASFRTPVDAPTPAPQPVPAQQPVGDSGGRSIDLGMAPGVIPEVGPQFRANDLRAEPVRPVARPAQTERAHAAPAEDSAPEFRDGFFSLAQQQPERPVSPIPPVPARSNGYGQSPGLFTQIIEPRSTPPMPANPAVIPPPPPPQRRPSAVPVVVALAALFVALAIILGLLFWKG